MEKVEKIKELVNQFNIEKQQLSKKIAEIEAQRTILAQIRNNKKAIRDNSFESQEEIKQLGLKISELGNESQKLQDDINAKSINLKQQICEIISQILAEELGRLRRTINKKQYEKDVYQQIERYCDTDQQIAQIEKIIGIEKQEKEIREKQHILSGLVQKVNCNQVSLVIGVLEGLYANTVIQEEINIADFMPVEEQEIITAEAGDTVVNQEDIKTISNIVIKFEKGELVYKATLSDGEEVNFFPTREKLVNKKEFISNLKRQLISYVIKAHKILDNSVVKNVDPNICMLLEKIAEEHEFNYFELVYDYAMSFSQEEEVRTGNAPIILYNLYYIKESKLSLRERTRLIKASKDAEKKADFDVMGYNMAFLRIEYFLRRVLGFNKLKEISGEKIS